jgi:nucleotide-binding universal stress UspA family protein
MRPRGTPRNHRPVSRTTILVGYDAHAAAERALDRAIQEARTRDGQLVVLAVAKMPLDPQGPQNFGTLDDAPLEGLPSAPPPEQEQALAAARRKVAEAAIPAQYLWTAGDPSASIVHVARDKRASLVVLGEHHHSLFGGLFGTDVAKNVAGELGPETIVVA